MSLLSKIMLVTVCFACVLSAQSVTFTGDVAMDFPAASSLIIMDPPGAPDVGVPMQFPPATISGWDMENAAIGYDLASDTIYLGWNTYGISGDADGDGDPNVTGATLGGLGGIDTPNFSGTEAAGAYFDLDNNGSFDLAIGIPSTGDISSAQSAMFSGTIFAAGFAFGAPMAAMTPSVFTAPSAAAPDLEMSVPGFGALLSTFVQPGQTDIAVTFFMGSFSDAGIGEDYVPDPVPLMIPLSYFCAGASATVLDLGAACNVMGEPVLSVDPPIIGQMGCVTVTSPHPNSHFWLYGSIGPVTPIVDATSGCTIFVDVLNTANGLVLIDETFTDANGDYMNCWQVPFDPSRIGFEVVLQARTWFPGGPISGDWLSNGVRITVGCP